MHVLYRSFFCLLLGVITSLAVAQTTTPTLRLRGVVQQATATTLTLKERGGEVIELALPKELAVSEVYPIALTDIQPGSFIGTAAVPQVDGTQRAIAVTVFPETARGLGEGHRPFDLQPQSTMTNATVDQVVAGASGRTLQVKYKDGEKTIVVPPEAPIVTFRPGDRSLLVPGASVSLSAQAVDGVPTVLRISAGRNGFQLPY
ncbi:hypothetical protein [Rhodoferax saidenbachensis]|uniref:DUF5666 domain-containing protein n=1 Tax=Rhodoferax saidenbachensis TaxID=1484693 RepID=A0ABU1ZHN4_9BURK|nr:hypothetical protein [Rhodoferax saidenbachensis]MDR7305046.1 hypothetical protein [Rhodoferax saidenbachensis]